VLFREAEDDTADRRRFERWLLSSPECVRAYLEISALWKQSATLDPQRRYDTDTLIAQGRERSSTVASLPRNASPIATQQSREAPAVRRWLATAACIAVAVSVLGVLSWMQRAPVFSTMLGEQRSFALADGSTVILNSSTKIRVKLSDRERRVELLAGQALFSVAKDRARPFIVTSGSTQVRAVGTQFDVYKKAADTIVTVIEGRVAISEESTSLASAEMARSAPGVSDGRSGGESGPVLLSAGDQLLVPATAPPQQARPDLAAVTAWTNRQLVFKGARLADVAAEFNRYNPRKLLIEDPRLNDFLISGNFSSTSPASLLNFLRMQPGIRVQEQDDEVVVTGAPLEN